MKRALRFIIPLLVLAIIVTLALHTMAGKGISSGICLVADHGSHLIILDGSPVVMGNQTGREDAFADLETGDKLWIIHDGIQETYPGKTGVYLVIRRGDGDINDIPAAVLDSLRELGWIS